MIVEFCGMPCNVRVFESKIRLELQSVEFLGLRKSRVGKPSGRCRLHESVVGMIESNPSNGDPS